MATVHLSLSTSPPLYEAPIVGEKRVLRLVEEPNGRPFSWSFKLMHNGETVYEDPDCFPYHEQLREFAAALRDGRPPLASLADMLPTMRTMDAAIDSMARGEPVRVATS